MPLFFGGTGVTPDLQGNVTNVIELQAGAVYPLPNNWFEAKPGKYTVIQEYDPITGIWRAIGSGSTGASLERIKGDGNNYRLANQTGCVVGALLTTAGTNYTSAPTCTAGSGGAIFRCIVGGAVNTSVTVSNGGTGYVYPPLVLIAAPPPGGIQATGYCTLSGTAVSTVTITDQGAGYSSPPVITLQNDPREGQNGVATGSGAAAVATLTGANTITGIVVVDHGTAVTSVPVLTIAGGGGSSGAATAIMCFSITSYSVSATTTGSGYASPTILSAFGGFPATAAAYTNPYTQSALVKGRNAFIQAALSGTALTATGQTVSDGGVYPGVPTIYVASSWPQGAGAVAATLTANVGGQTDTSMVLTT